MNAKLSPLFQKMTIRLLSRLDKLPSNGSGGKVVYVTSAREGEGKTFMASWLARTAASISEQKVLLIDGNMESPVLQRVFGPGALPGFSDVLATRDWSRACFRATDVTNLQVLTAGSQPLPGLLFQQEVLLDFLASVRSHFDLIFIDSASIVQSGANSLSTLADGIFLVIDASQTRWQVVDYALTELNVSKSKLLGATLNKKVQHIPQFLYDRL